MPIIGYIPDRDTPYLLPKGTFLGEIQTSPALVLDSVKLEAGNVIFNLIVPPNANREVYMSRTGIRMVINRLGGVRSNELIAPENVVSTPDISVLEEN